MNRKVSQDTVEFYNGRVVESSGEPFQFNPFFYWIELCRQLLFGAFGKSKMTAAHIVPNVADAAASSSTSSLDNETEKIIHNSTTTTKGRLWVQSSVKDALAGAAAGAFAKTAVAPIERVKLLLQLQLSLDKSTGSTLKQPNGYAGNASQVAWKVYANQGILAFWRGE